MATTFSDAESGLDYEDEDEIYFNLSHDELVQVVKYLIVHYHLR